VKQSASVLVLLVFLSVILVSIPQIGVVKAENTIYIRADGNIEGTDKIHRDGNVYTFLGNITIEGSGIDGIIVEKDNIVIDGADYNLQITGSMESSIGIKLMERTNVTINNLRILNFNYGIQFRKSSYIKVCRNNIENCVSGIHLYINSNHISIIGNNITGNSYGIHLNEGGGNEIYGNNIENNGIGIFIVNSRLNNIYHNNFVNNTEQVRFHSFWMPPFAGPQDNLWNYNYPGGGNYWSDYKERYPNSTELDVLGIWNTTYIIAESNQDYYPLMAPITVFDAGVWEWTSYNVDVISNSTVSGFSFDPEEGSLIRFNVEGEEGTIGFCRVRIPKDLLHTEGNWNVLVDETPVTPSINEDKGNTYLYFTYQHNTKILEIIGTDAIPEFPSWTPLLVMLSVLAVALVVYKRRLKKSFSTVRGARFD